MSEAIASVGDLTSRANDVISGSVPAVTSANETSAQTAPNAIYIDGNGCCCITISTLFNINPF